jgi:hypothetical protein
MFKPSARIVSNFYDNNQRQNDNKAGTTLNFSKLTEI